MSLRTASINNSFPRVFLIAALILAGVAVGLLAQFVHFSDLQKVEAVAGWSLLKIASVLSAGAILVFVLVRYPEIALGLFFLVGMVKADPRLAASPVDLTVFIGGIIAAGSVIKLLSLRRSLLLPKEYVWYLPLVALMVLSLFYTPSLPAGTEKLLRFVFLTGLGIVTPFVNFDSTVRVRRFLVTMMVGGAVLAINSFAMLGGSERLVSPSGLNTELGAACGISLLILWGLLFAEWSLPKRILFYPVIGVLAIALIGSGARFANVSTVLCVILGALLCRKLMGDLAVVGVMGLLALPLVWIPSASYEYLSSLHHPTQAMGTRSDLIALGLKTAFEHPVLGVGISGFKFISPNPLTYNYPHNLILELASEMGALAAMAFLVIAFCSFREILKQLASPALKNDSLVRTVFLLLIFVFLDAMVSGDINDMRFMWFVFGLPFLLRILHEEEPQRAIDLVAAEPLKEERAYGQRVAQPVRGT